MFKSSYGFFISLFGLIITFVVFVNFNIWSGNVINAGLDSVSSTNQYFGFSSIISVVQFIGEMEDQPFLNFNDFRNMLNQLYIVNVKLPYIIQELSSVDLTDGASGEDILTLLRTFLMTIFMFLGAPVIDLLSIVYIFIYVLTWVGIFTDVVFKVLLGYFNVGSLYDRSDLLPSIVSVLLKTPFSPFGV